MKVGDRVKRNNVLEFEGQDGTVIEVSEDYFVVKWDNNFGFWKYSERSARLRGIELLSCSSG